MTANHFVFEEGLFVRYKCHSGVINFICKNYITILIKKGEHRSQDTSILIYRNDFNLVESESVK